MVAHGRGTSFSQTDIYLLEVLKFVSSSGMVRRFREEFNLDTLLDL